VQKEVNLLPVVKNRRGIFAEDLTSLAIWTWACHGC